MVMLPNNVDILVHVGDGHLAVLAAHANILAVACRRPAVTGNEPVVNLKVQKQAARANEQAMCRPGEPHVTEGQIGLGVRMRREVLDEAAHAIFYHLMLCGVKSEAHLLAAVDVIDEGSYAARARLARPKELHDNFMSHMSHNGPRTVTLF